MKIHPYKGARRKSEMVTSYPPPLIKCKILLPKEEQNCIITTPAGRGIAICTILNLKGDPDILNQGYFRSIEK